MNQRNRLHIETKGDRSHPAVILLHGFLGSARNLRRFSEAIADAGFFVVTYDQRGHGRSPWLKPYNFDAMASDLVGVLDQENINRAHFIGHSMGGRVCLAATAIAPERVLSLTLLDVGPNISERALSEIRNIVAPLKVSYINRAEAEESLQSHALAMRQFLLSNLRSETSDGPLQWTFDLEGLREALRIDVFRDQSEILRKVRAPILLLRGQKSHHFSEIELKSAVALNSKIQTETIPNAAHWLHAENFEGLCAALIPWIQGLH